LRYEKSNLKKKNKTNSEKEVYFLFIKLSLNIEKYCVKTFVGVTQTVTVKVIIKLYNITL